MGLKVPSIPSYQTRVFERSIILFTYFMHAHQLRLAKMSETHKSVRRLHNPSCDNVAKAMFFHHLHKLLEQHTTFMIKYIEFVQTNTQLMHNPGLLQQKIRECGTYRGRLGLIHSNEKRVKRALKVRAELREQFRTQNCQRQRRIIVYAVKVLTGKYLPVELEEMIAAHLQY